MPMTASPFLLRVQSSTRAHPLNSLGICQEYCRSTSVTTDLRESGQTMPSMDFSFLPNSSANSDSGHTIVSTGRREESVNSSFRREGGHATLSRGWLKFPRRSLSREAGHTTRSIGWLNRPPKHRWVTDAGQCTSAIGWSKKHSSTGNWNLVPQNDSRCRYIAWPYYILLGWAG